jgi:hypothetical protein
MATKSQDALWDHVERQAEELSGESLAHQVWIDGNVQLGEVAAGCEACTADCGVVLALEQAEYHIQAIEYYACACMTGL